jgi:hypothetical protein
MSALKSVLDFPNLFSGTKAFVAHLLISTCLVIFVYGYAKNEGVKLERRSNTIERQKYENQIIHLQLELVKEQNNIKERIVNKYIDKVKIVKEKEYVYVNQSSSVPDTTILSTGWVHLHDSAATNSDADPAVVTDANPSGIATNIALGTIAGNYSTCEQTRQQLIALQDWIRQTQEQMEEKK